MKRSLLSEKKLVVVLFVTVIIIFSFAQADTKKIEKMFLDTPGSSPATTSFDQPENPGPGSKTREGRLFLPTLQLR